MKSAIIGCGGVANIHAQCLKENRYTNIVACCDIELSKAKDFSQKYNCQYYTDWEKMLNIQKPDVVHICTPHYLHAPMAAYALKNDINVFMEKPPVTSFSQYEMLKEMLNFTNNKKIIGVCFQNRYNNTTQYVKNIMESNTYGKILGARGFVTWNRDEYYYKNSTWRGKKDLECGGALINQGIHTLDLLLYLVGKKPLSVQSTMDNLHLKNVIEVEDTLSARIVYEDFISQFFVTTGFSLNSSPQIDIMCEDATLRIEGEYVTIFYSNGTIEYKNLNGEKKLGKEYWGYGHKLCIDDFYKSIQNKTEFSLDFKNLDNTIQTFLNIYKEAEHN